MRRFALFLVLCGSVFAAEHLPESFEFSGTDLDYKAASLPQREDAPPPTEGLTATHLDCAGTDLDFKTPTSFSLQVPGQTPVGIFGSGTASCGTPVATNLKGWYSTDCMTAISPCATSYANSHTFTGGEGWKDRSGNANDISADAVVPGCVFHTNQLNGLPDVTFNGICGWDVPAGVDSGATSWAAFVVFQNTTTANTYFGSFLGSASTGQINYFTAGIGSGASAQNLNKKGITAIASGNAAADLNWHRGYFGFSNQSDQNTMVFRLNGASDGPSSFTSANVTAGITLLGIRRDTGTFTVGLQGNITEMLVYTGTGVILTAGNITTNEAYLNCRYPSAL